MTQEADNASSAPLGELVFRADASATMGTGHVMRCLALAQAWLARDGTATLVSSCDSAGLRDRIRGASVSLTDAPSAQSLEQDLALVTSVAAEQRAVCIVVDGYRFGEEYQLGIKSSGANLAVFDDYMHVDHYHSDLVINQNLDAEKLDYFRERDTRLLLGTRYVILRPEFGRWRNWTRTCPGRARRVLVTLGGSDPDNVTERAIRALETLGQSDLEVRVVVGASNPHRSALGSAAAAPGMNIRIDYDVQDMAERMAWADVAVAAGGTTCWELAFMGLPSAIIVLADNQARSADALARHGVAQVLGRSETLTVEALAAALKSLIEDASARKEMAETGRRLVDGLGADRVVDAIAAMSGRHG